MAYGIEDHELLPLVAGDTEHLCAYGEEDDLVTQVIDAAIAEPKWIVQVTPLDRRMMATAELLSEAMRGALVRQDTLVWRGGMDDWLPLEEVEALASVWRQLPTLSPRAESRKSGRAALARGRVVSNGLLASVAIVLSTAALTISALAVCGVFDSDPVKDAPGTSVSASSR